MFYKHDLSIYAGQLTMLAMWKPTHNNTRTTEHRLSFSIYYDCKTVVKWHFGKVLNPKYI